MTLRTKLSISLMGMSLVTILVMGFSARALMLNRFDDYIVARAVIGFTHEVSLYYAEYGSWEEAAANETFFEFVRRYRQEGGEQRAASRDARPGTGARGDRPPGPPGEGAGKPPHRSFLGGPPPPFIATDLDGAVVLPIHGYSMGDPMPADLVDQGTPIQLNGEIIGLAVPQSRPALSAMEEHYLASVEDAWMLSLILALGLAIPLGIFLGNRLARPIRELNRAMAGMQRGSLRQQVTATSSDELGQLAERFNRMSSRLADTYEELERSRAGLAELSLRDELTDLHNRRAFDELTGTLLAQARRYGHPMVIGMLDVDRFKKINDQFGHALGDEVLVRAAAILRSTLRDTDVVARWGGEEFAIAFPETTPDGAARLAERVRASFERTDWRDLLPRPVTVSIGLAEILPGDELADVMARADERLYEAKDGGRNRVHG